MSRILKPQLREVAFGGANQAATAGAFSLVAVYNPSSSRFVTVIRHYEASLTVADAIGFYLLHGQVGSNTNTEQPMVAGEAKKNGVIQTGTVAALPTAITRTTIPGNNYLAWLHEWPVAVLLPGWSFVAACQVVNVTLNCTFWWEGVYAELFWQDPEDPELG